MRKLSPFLLVVLFVSVLIPLHAAPVQAWAEPAPPAQGGGPFREGDCPAEVQSRLGAFPDVRCGVLTVPEFHAKPEGKTIELDVVILPARMDAQPDPIVFAQGGPGGSTIDYFTQVIPASRIWTDRDIILFDQRGTKFSRPSLYCPEVFDSIVKSLPLDLDPAESNQVYTESALACRERLLKEGVDLSAYNSIENARDIDLLRQALGYEKINLYGVSYGTLLALHAMRTVPEGLRSVILDAVVPTDRDFNFDAPNSQNRAYTELFEACNAEPSCREHYPDLETRFFALAKKLDENPVMVNLMDYDTGERHEALINGEALIGTVFQMMYVSEFIPLLPRMVERMEQGEYTLLEKTLSLVMFDRTMNYAMYYSIVCAEDGLVDPNYSYEDVRPELMSGIEAGNAEMVKLCTKWDVKQLGDAADKPVVSDLPVLIFNGRFDPITPPSYGEEAAKTLTKSFSYTFPNTGHGALFSSVCADSIFQAFLANPDKEPNSSCIASLPPLHFLTDEEVVDLPLMVDLAMLKGPFVQQVIAFGVLVAILLSSVLVFPIAWLVTRSRKKDGSEIPQLAYLASWLPPLNAAALIALGVGLFGSVIMLVMQERTGMLYFGLPREHASVLLITVVIVLLTVAMLALGAVGFAGRFWSTLRKVYYGVLILAALGACGLLAYWGLFTWWV